ncbi:MAG: ArnT family glycosyltransferase [Chthoniobacterales bacterium]
MASKQRRRKPSPNRSRRIEILVVAAFCAMFAFLSARQAAVSSATFDETSHLPSGYSYLTWRDYRMNPEHPPFAKMFAALPLLLWFEPWPHKEDLAGWSDDSLPSNRWLHRTWNAAVADPNEAEWVFGQQMLYGVRDEALRSHGVESPLQIPAGARLQPGDFLNDADELLFSARMMILVLGVALAVLVYLWTRELFGVAGGMLALALFCLDPNFIAHSSLVTTDVAVSLFMFGAVYFLWRACRRLNAGNVILSASFFALAFVTKFSAVLLVPIFVLIGLGRIFPHEEWPSALGLSTRWRRALAFAALLAVCAVAAFIAIWTIYAFRYSAMTDPQRAAGAARQYLPANYSFDHEPGTLPIGNVVRRTAAIKSLLAKNPETPRDDAILAAMSAAKPDALGRLVLFAQRHRLLPEAWLYGFAYTKMTSLQRSSFLMGAYSDRGFHTYFLWTFLFKTPLPTLLAIAAALVVAARRRMPWASRAAFLAVPVIVYALVSLGANLNIGHRHLLPMYPFLFVLCGVLVLPWRSGKLAARLWSAAIALAVIAIASSVVFAPPWLPQIVYPHYLAYFNELAGGPDNGHRQLVDSNLDWGQDLKGLRDWMDEHLEIGESINLCYFGMADPRYYGIPHVAMPGGYLYEPQENYIKTPDNVVGITNAVSPGYLAISATNLEGVYFSEQARDLWREILKHATLVDNVGHSILIYKIEAIPTK